MSDPIKSDESHPTMYESQSTTPTVIDPMKSEESHTTMSEESKEMVMKSEETKEMMKDRLTSEEVKFMASIGVDVNQWVQNRLQKLRGILENQDLKHLHKSVAFAITLYESGELPKLRGTTWIIDDKIVPRAPLCKDVPEGSVLWPEGGLKGQQLMQSSHTPQNMGMQLASTGFPFNFQHGMHQIFARIRPISSSGLPSNNVDIVFMNDTGSDLLGLFPSDLQQISISEQNYASYMTLIDVQTVGGSVQRTRVYIDMQILKEDGTIISEWMMESAIIIPPPVQHGDLQVRLSGNVMRDHLYFATAPGNATLFVACKKNGIVAQLPVV